MRDCKNEISNIRRISATLLVPYSQIDERNPLEKGKIKPSQFTGLLELKPFKMISVAIDVSNVRLPVQYNF